MAKNKKKSNLPLILLAAAAVCLVIVAVAVPKLSKEAAPASTEEAQSGTEEQSGADQSADAAGTGAGNVSSEADAGDAEDADGADAAEAEDVQIIEEGGSLVISKADVSSSAVFYPIEVDGTRMEVLAVEDSDGNIRTAFNTCQICYSSGRGYYVQEGDALVCQNCGNVFTVDQVEIESGGCNPWPIFAENKTETDESIEISYEFLKESKDIFENWKI